MSIWPNGLLHCAPPPELLESLTVRRLSNNCRGGGVNHTFTTESLLPLILSLHSLLSQQPLHSLLSLLWYCYNCLNYLYFQHKNHNVTTNNLLLLIMSLQSLLSQQRLLLSILSLLSLPSQQPLPSILSLLRYCHYLHYCHYWDIVTTAMTISTFSTKIILSPQKFYYCLYCHYCRYYHCSHYLQYCHYWDIVTTGALCTAELAWLSVTTVCTCSTKIILSSQKLDNCQYCHYCHYQSSHLHYCHS